MKYINLLIFTTFLLFSENITEIKIKGNNITQDYIIFREIMHPIHSEFSDSLRIEDENRLYNLGIFSFVEINQINNIYQIHVNEIFRYYLLPLVDIDESNKNGGTSYGLAFSILNLNGKNRKFEAGTMFGNKHLYFFNFSDPWIFGNHISSEINFFQKYEQLFWYDNSIENDFKNIIKGFQFGVGFHIGLKNNFNFNLGFFNNKIDFSNYIETEIIQEYQNIGIKLTYSLDSRDIIIDPTKGTLLKFNFNQNIGINSSKSFSNLFLEINKHFKISDFKDFTINLKSKLLLQNPNHIPIFNYHSLGGEDFVRGYNRYPNSNPAEIQSKIRANQLFSHSLEFQFTLVEKKSFDGFEFGLDNIWFIDIGIGTIYLDEFLEAKALKSYGVGFRFFLSGIGTIGFDIGFNPYSSTPQLHISDSKDD
ncbi:MAG: hypothetical protein CMF96_01325 [Candidatus Marinimicrobia bacterium]|nr:hypothetical protein [Candidatus Neomarinimicrobiota bacterium]|tara:strand:- start:8195 stop:9457 length:1263 start_codon:yes stop_codon:yes gene_type:complete